MPQPYWSILWRAVLLSSAVAPRAYAANDQVTYAPPSAWVLPPPTPTEAPTPPDAPMRFVYTDEQVHVGPTGEEIFGAWRVRILKPEALQAGNVTITWDPSSGSATVHRLNIIRDGVVIDILKDQRFRVIQREGGLEQSILDGRLTATLQTPGLRIGDELEFAATTTHRDPTLDDHGFGVSQLPTQGMPGAFRFRLGWTDTQKIAWRATRDLPQAVPAKAGAETSIDYELRDPSGVIVDDGAPARYNVRRQVEYSDFTDWRDVSRRFAPLFEKAAALSAQSPIRAEAAKIAAASPDLARRTEAALKLVQEQIRYVYVGLDGGNYRPTAADETWQRRFGDCKAKTALLLALLRALKIDAEPVLVNATGDDGLNAYLPSPQLFNHVLVRVKIGDGRYWLDGTRLGDRHLDMLPAPTFQWALPARSSGADLEAVPPRTPERPQFVAVVDIDASGGIGKEAHVKAQHVMREDEAYATQARLAAMSREDADRAVGAYWRQQMGWVEPDTVAWRYDERKTTLLLSLDGKGKPDWEGDEKEGRSFDIPGAGFYAPDLLRRPKEQDQGAPWVTKFPRFRCFATSIRLPMPRSGWRWRYYAQPVDRKLGGVLYRRASGLQKNIMRTVMSSQAFLSEISAAQAKEQNDAIPAFNNKISRVYEEEGEPNAASSTADAPFIDETDWTGDAPQCGGPITP